MTKRKTKKAQKEVGPILDKMQNRVGHLTAEMVYFKHNPAAFIERILNSDPEEVAQIILQNTGIMPEYIEAMKAEPDKPLSFEFEDGVGVTFPDTLTFSEALQYAREMREAIDRAFEERLKKAAPAQYPLSLAIIKGITGTAAENAKCIDENKLNQAAHLKLEHIFLTLLNETSAERNPKAPGYLTGNLGAELVTMQGGLSHESAGVEVELKEVFKRWKGEGKEVGGTDKKYIARVIKEYRELVFTWQFRTEVGGQLLTIEHTAPRVGVLLYNLTDKKGAAGGELITQAGAKVVLRFHPAFLAFKAGDNYANTPANLSEIIETAAGGGRNVTAAHWRLFHYLNSIRSTTRPGGEKGGVVRTEIGRRELMVKIGLDGYLHSRNESRGEEALRGVIADIQKTGLLSGHSTRSGNSGPVFCFEINKEPVYIQSAPKKSKKGG